MYTVTKGFEFSAAHHLPGYEGKCEDVHGHNYRFDVSVTGEVLDRLGMLIDFADLGKIVQENILDILDHSDLNDQIPQPTAENTAKWIYERLKPLLQTERYHLDKVIVLENDKSAASYKKSES